MSEFAPEPTDDEPDTDDSDAGDTGTTSEPGDTVTLAVTAPWGVVAYVAPDLDLTVSDLGSPVPSASADGLIQRAAADGVTLSTKD